MQRLMPRLHIRFVLLLFALTGIMGLTWPAFGADSEATVDYYNPDNWAYYEDSGEKAADCVLICPTSECKDKSITNIDINNPKHRKEFVACLNMERHVYDENANMYAPYYRAITFTAYDTDKATRKKALDLAYCDVENALNYYLVKSDPTRPLFLAGFSQGSEHLLRYLQRNGNSPLLRKRLVAVYALGWHFSTQEVDPYPWIKMAQSADDVGTVITFDCDAPGVKPSFIVPEGMFTYSINPLTWRTDFEMADKSLHHGADFYDGDGNCTKHIDHLTGCYIDRERGTLICPDINPKDYPGIIFPNGKYHIYDYFFFSKNIQENMKTRLQAFLAHCVDNAP